MRRAGLDNFLRGAESRELRDQFAGGIYGNRISIEDQLVVSTDCVAITDRPLMRAGERRDHFAPDGRLVQTKGRRAEIEDDLGSLFHQSADRLDVVERARQVML